jgi:hypothetical protein
LRYWKSTISQVVIVPLVILLLLYVIQTSINGNATTAINQSPAVINVGGIPMCQVFLRGLITAD